MASIWKLPVLFVCENNQFATEVPFAYAAGNPSVASRGASYGMPGVEVDGNDVMAVYEAAARGRRSRPSRRRADAARMQDLPHPAARRGHGRLHLPHPRGGRGLEDSLPDPAPAEPRSTSELANGICPARRHRGRDRDGRRRGASGSPSRAPGPTPPRRPGSSTPKHGRGSRVVVLAGRQRSLRASRPRDHLHAGDARGPDRGDGAKLRRSSSWAKGSASAAATSRRRPGFTTCTAPSGSATRRSASAASSASAAAPP